MKKSLINLNKFIFQYFVNFPKLLIFIIKQRTMIGFLLILNSTILMVMLNKTTQLNKELEDKNNLINKILNDELLRQNRRTRKE